MSNTLKTTVLLALLTGLMLWIGEALGGTNGMVVALAFAVVMNFGSWWFSDRIVLAMYGAQPLSEAEAPDLYRVVRELAAAAQIPMPPVYLIPSESPNAFATGRSPSHAAVAVTQGILRILTVDELRGVLGHELGHVVHRDTLTSTVAATLAGVIMMLGRLAYWSALFGGGRRDERDEGGGALGLLATMILAPLAASLIQMAISRSREYAADEAGARYYHNPLALASALEKISIGAARVPLAAGPATAHLFIVNPLRGNWLANLFSTHPPTEERIRRLRSMIA